MKLKKPNKRMLEYWLDEAEDGQIIPLKIPYNYVIEMFCDMVGASRAYNPKNWKPDMLWGYWITKCQDKRIMHKESVYLVEKLIWNMKELGYEEFFKSYKRYKKYLKEAYNNGTLMFELDPLADF